MAQPLFPVTPDAPFLTSEWSPFFLFSFWLISPEKRGIPQGLQAGCGIVLQGCKKTCQVPTGKLDYKLLEELMGWRTVSPPWALSPALLSQTSCLRWLSIDYCCWSHELPNEACFSDSFHVCLREKALKCIPVRQHLTNPILDWLFPDFYSSIPILYVRGF